MRLITLVQQNDLDGRPERHVAYVYAFAHITRNAIRMASASGCSLIALVAAGIAVVVVTAGAQHPRRHIAALSQQRR